MSDDRRLLDCVKAWPDAESGMYDQRCCRFPKSCSPYPYDEQVALGNVELEPAPSPIPAAPDTTGVDLWAAIFAAMPVTVWQAFHGPCETPTRDYREAAADAVLALPALRDLLAERDTLAAQVRAVEGLAAYWGRPEHSPTWLAASRVLRRALGTPTTGGGE